MSKQDVMGPRFGGAPHSPSCRKILQRCGFVEMRQLAPTEQRIVLDCPHRSHDSVRHIWRVR